MRGSLSVDYTPEDILLLLLCIAMKTEAASIKILYDKNLL